MGNKEKLQNVNIDETVHLILEKLLEVKNTICKRANFKIIGNESMK